MGEAGVAKRLDRFLMAESLLELTTDIELGILAQVFLIIFPSVTLHLYPTHLQVYPRERGPNFFDQEGCYQAIVVMVGPFGPSFRSTIA